MWVLEDAVWALLTVAWTHWGWILCEVIWVLREAIWVVYELGAAGADVGVLGGDAGAPRVDFKLGAVLEVAL